MERNREGGEKMAAPPAISALHSFFFTRKRKFEAEKAAPQIISDLKRVLTVCRELWYDFIMIK